MEAQDVSNPLCLLGEKESWHESSWKASDDRVRGGKSVSHLTVTTDAAPAALPTEPGVGAGVGAPPSPPPSGRDRGFAHFHGHLDTTALGGAGFASQKLDVSWDLSSYGALYLTGLSGDAKTCTLVLKDTSLPRRPDGREQSTVSFEAEVRPHEYGPQVLLVPLDHFRPHYRGKPCEDAAPLDRSNIKSFSIMARSYFGKQEGDFRLSVRSIGAGSPVGPGGSSLASVDSSAADLKRDVPGGDRAA